MKKFIQNLKNIWAIDELRDKIILTLLMLLVFRIGSYIVLPGIDPNGLANLNKNASKGLLGIFDSFAGGAFSNASIFALGIMPYISASIFMQLVTILVPQIQKVQKEGESGRKKINQWTRYLTAIVTLFQGGAYVAYLSNPQIAGGAILPAFQTLFPITTVIVLTAGTLFVMWLGEKITDKGLGNGTSIIIMVGIMARFPASLTQEFSSQTAKGGHGLLVFLIELAFLVLTIMALIVLVQGTRKIAVNYAKQIIGNRQFGGARQFLPLKVNSAGVMPIIFAQAIMFIPGLLSSFQMTAGLGRIFNDHGNIWYMLIYCILVVGFTFLYTALIFNPKQVADDLKRNNGFVPGVKPGQPTADYIGTIMDRITFPGAIFLAIVGILPGIARNLGVTAGFSTFYGGTSLLIMVAVILDTLQMVETHLLMRQYDGLMKSGRIQGRAAATSIGGTGVI